MSREVMPGLFVGDLDDYHRGGFHAYVSATKSVHKEVVGAGRDHPDYIFKERPHHLIFNWVDGPARLYDWSGPEAFTRSNDFIERNLKEGNVLVHCDQGFSRSPTLAMVYLSKRAGVLPEGFMDAYHAFRSIIYPGYLPGGILDYVKTHWDEIR